MIAMKEGRRKTTQHTKTSKNEAVTSAMVKRYSLYVMRTFEIKTYAIIHGSCEGKPAGTGTSKEEAVTSAMVKRYSLYEM
ncbi:hypothetical protein J6590_092512 [Homalodisca vitripennis]|nr:hypothetical protein J6590_047258 [Homalodisca vitripennis]KAG8294893.1 hypothetical protein J6590_092512 [Homalodisca vitripennis]